MNTSFDSLTAASPLPSAIEWMARCSKRLVGLDPGLGVEQALDLARDMSHDAAMRARSPERAAEHRHQLTQQQQFDAG